MTTLLLIIGVVIVAVLLSAALLGPDFTMIAIAIVGLGVIPRRLDYYIGDFQVGTYSIVAAILTVLAFLAVKRQGIPWMLIPFIVLLGLGFATEWPGTGEQLSWSAMLLLSVGTFAAGSLYGSRFSIDSLDAKRIAMLLLAVVVFELVICAMQYVGIGVFAIEGRSADLTEGRSNGTLDHPSAVGRHLLILAMMTLPLSRSSDKATARMATWATLLMVIPIGLSESRANIAAILIMIIVWALIQPRERGIAARVALPAGALVVALLFSDQIFNRFAADEEGGQRAHFLEIALKQIPLTPWFGVGPGSYITVLGRSDALTAEGWRVHNAFLLEIVELGIIGAVLFFMPLIVGSLRSMKRWRAVDSRGHSARAFIAVFIGMMPIATTGWGLMNTFSTHLWFFVLGFCLSQMKYDTSPIEIPDKIGRRTRSAPTGRTTQSTRTAPRTPVSAAPAARRTGASWQQRR